MPFPNSIPHQDAHGMLLHNPQWKQPVTSAINKLFIEAVVDAIQLAQVSSRATLFPSLTVQLLIQLDRLSLWLGYDVKGGQYTRLPRHISDSYLSCIHLMAMVHT